MNDLKNNKNYAHAKGPVNRRTAAAAPVPAAPVAPSVRARIGMVRAKHRLGAPLSQRLAASVPGHSLHTRPTAAAILQVVSATICATGLGLGVIQGSVWLMGGSASALGAVALWVVASRRSRSAQADQPVIAAVDVLDAQALERLDALMEKMSLQARQATLDRLTRLKESIVRCFVLVNSAMADASPSSEESLYLREAVRRYIPDSINSCLQVPQKDRASVVIDGSKPALDLLHDQLEMIQLQLDAREARLTQVAGEALMRQQRFLAAKSAERV